LSRKFIFSWRLTKVTSAMVVSFHDEDQVFSVILIKL